MTGIFGTLNMGKRALLAQQLAINVTGHNISNVNTEGYSRQKVVMETNPPTSAWPGQVGTGVRAAQINRVYDHFLGTQIQDEKTNLGRWEAQQSGLKNIDAIFNESNGYGLNQTMNEFWNSWQELSNNPSSITERNNVVEKGKALSSAFHRIHDELEQAQQQADDNIKATIDRINTLAEQIADLNKNISSVEANGQKANDYRDQRDMLVKDLSSLIDIKTFENNNGQLDIILGSGRPLVSNSSFQSLSADIRGDGLNDVVWNDGYGTSVNITNNISGGELKGWLEVRDTNIDNYLGKLDSLAGGIISGVNGLHSTGYGLNRSTNGQNFFSGTDASDIGVNSNIVNDVTLIAAANNSGGAPGDNLNAVAIVNLQNSLLMNGNSATYNSFYSSLISEAGNASATASANREHQSSIITYLENRREAVSGVSLDEEMVNLIKFQHAYESAAKVISTADELLDTLIDMVR